MPRKTPAERFWSQADVAGESECWEWAAYKTSLGYGRFKYEGKTHAAHRVAYTLTFGEIPGGMELDHTCWNRGCVNPAHLKAVTRKHNVENLAGLKSNNTSGARGVYWVENVQKWRVCVQHDGRKYFGGYFRNLDEAAERARQMRLELFVNNLEDRNAA